MKLETGTAPSVSIITAHGRTTLKADATDRLIDVFQKNSVPWSAVAVYGKSKDAENLSLLSGLDKSLQSFSEFEELLVYYNRNINPFLFSVSQFSLIEGDQSSIGAGTEYFYQNYDNDNSACKTYLKKLTSDECKTIIAERVAATIAETVEDGAKIVVGISGGGDSNAMLHGLSQLKNVEIFPVIIKGIPDWDLGVPRAQGLCDKYGYDLRIIESEEVEAILGIEPSSVSLVDRFEREFPGDDFEFLGTLLIRLSLIKYAKELNTKYICTGLNLEDVLCENLFRVTSGMKPASVPARQIGDHVLLMPLWLCPKRIIDGCFPKLSLDNYDARYPCFSLGRNLYYSVIYAIQSQFPGYSEKMAIGISKLALENPVEYTYDEALGFHVERFVPFPIRQKFKKMIS